ncbi:hypothetical protein [Oceanidesulfovibrio indonesiensis]|uniref:hypothetical protein n=1 Tax=Oceanidesulfovibrio indonesiensis TaxID=54767 RepID=UPI00129483DE|nr:hypothetical protein [Oceanidesulfovibrio indonesiensis]
MRRKMSTGPGGDMPAANSKQRKRPRLAAWMMMRQRLDRARLGEALSGGAELVLLRP